MNCIKKKWLKGYKLNNNKHAMATIVMYWLLDLVLASLLCIAKIDPPPVGRALLAFIGNVVTGAA